MLVPQAHFCRLLGRDEAGSPPVLSRRSLWLLIRKATVTTVNFYCAFKPLPSFSLDVTGVGTSPCSHVDTITHDGAPASRGGLGTRRRPLALLRLLPGDSTVATWCGCPVP